MKKFSLIAAIASLVASGAVFAQQPVDAQATTARKPVAMNEAQMDKVTAGALINVALVDVVDVRDVAVQVAVPVNAAVAVGVLGGAIGTATQAPGRQFVLQ
jgi:hypothetical protein